MKRLIGAFDDRFAYPTFLSAASAKFQHPNLSWLLGYIDGEVRSGTLADVRHLCDALNLDLEIEGFPDDPLFTERHALSKTTFCKFRLTDQHTGPMLWLDSDVLAVGPFDGLLAETFRDKPAAQLVVASYRGNGFNAGVMGFTNSEREPWREALASQPEVRKNSEQNVFNEIYKGRFKEVPREYNFIWQWLYDVRQSEVPRLIHYGGPLKPWHLPLSLVDRCLESECSWSPWLKHEARVLKMLSGSSKRKALRMRRKSRMRPHLSSAYAWFIVMQLIGFLPTGLTRFLILIFTPLSKNMPAILHPFHGEKIDTK